MNIKKYLILLAAGVLTLTTSCRSDDPAPAPKPTPPATVTPDPINNFVWKALNSWYYWQANVPTLADSYAADNAKYTSLINGKTPDKLFYSLLYDYGNKDRFSWIENNNVIIKNTAKTAEVEKMTGLDLSVFSKGGGSSNYVALVNYVVPGSTAAAAGVKRGDVITKVNGSLLTSTNYSDLFGDSFSITRALTAKSEVVNGAYVITTTDRDESISISKTDVDENPIAFSKIYEMGGKKIGYLVYNGFKIDYNSQLNAKFAEFKAAGITDLILDLRYNGGGSLTSALGLAQMINGNNTGQNYVFMDFNNKHNAEDGYDVLSDKLGIYKVVNGHPEKTGEESINSLSLPKVYTLISFQTASASELTVISLNKFIPVETIGYLTVGKFVGSHTLYDSPAQDYMNYEQRNKTHNWQLQPITFAYYNKNREEHPTVNLQNGTTVEGIVPVLANRVHPYQWVGTVKEFGNVSDPELKKALEMITGQPVGKTTTQYTESRQPLISEYKNPAKGLYIDNMSEYLKRKKN